MDLFHDSDEHEKVTILLKYKDKVVAVASYKEIIIENKQDRSYERELLVEVEKVRRPSIFKKYIGDNAVGACIYYTSFGPYSTY